VEQPENHSDQTDTLKVKIWRGADKGEFVEYKVPQRTNQTVLDVVTEVQRHQEPALAYRMVNRAGPVVPM